MTDLVTPADLATAPGVTTPPEVVVIDDPHEASAGRVTDRRRRARRLAVSVVVVAIAAVVTMVLFEDFVAHLWFEGRQQNLVGQGTQVGPPRTGDQVGILQDPAIDLDVTMAQGDSAQVLRGAPGHRPGTPLPGQRGNSVIYGHRHDWGAPLSHLAKLSVGSILYVQSRAGLDYAYTVTSVKTEASTNQAPLMPTSDFRLTIITGAASRWNSNEVLVVTAVSGTAEKAPAKSRDNAGPSIEPGQQSVLVNPYAASFVVLLVVSVGMIGLLRRSHRRSFVLIVASPLLLATALPALLEVDRLLFAPLA